MQRSGQFRPATVSAQQLGPVQLDLPQREHPAAPVALLHFLHCRAREGETVQGCANGRQFVLGAHECGEEVTSAAFPVNPGDIPVTIQ